MEPWDAGWVAGLFEGEGCIVIRKTERDKDHIAVQLLLQMTDEDVVRRLLRVTGVGTFRGPLQARTRPRSKPLWSWFCGKEKDVAFVLMAIYPYMGERRRQKIHQAAEIFAQRQTNRLERYAPCGTRSAYNRHLRHGEPTCAACRAAANEDIKEHRRRTLVAADDGT